MSRIQLLHWNAIEARDYIDLLRANGYDVQYCAAFRPALMKSWRESPPDAFVIDLSRLPSHGREIAIALRHSPATQRIPVVFCEGAEKKISRIKAEVPDCIFAKRSTLRSALKRAIAHPPGDPVTPKAMMDRYASRTSAQKLGIKPSSTVFLIDPPRNAASVIGELPPHVELLEFDLAETRDARRAAVTLCFVRDLDALQSTLSTLRGRAADTKLWLLWRNGAQKEHSAVTERVVRDRANSLGLVDYKICSVNQIWSAMLFALKKNP